MFVAAGKLQQKGEAKASESIKEERAKQAAAVQMLQGYLQKHPDDVEALKMLLRVRMRCAEFSEGLDILNRLIRIQPEEREWRYLRAQVLEYSGDLASARRGFEELLEREPYSARALQGLAGVMRQCGEDSMVVGMVEGVVQKAEEEHSGGTEAEVTNLKLLLGQLHAMQGNVREALEVYDEIAEEHPADFRPYLCKGLVLSLAGEGEQADKQFRLFREKCPKAYAPYLDSVIVRSSVEARRQKMESKRGKGVWQMRQPENIPLPPDEEP